MKKPNLNCLNIDAAGAFGGRFIFLRIRSRLSNCRTLAQPPLFDTDLLLILIIILLQFFANMVTWSPLVTGGPTPQPPSHHCHQWIFICTGVVAVWDISAPSKDHMVLLHLVSYLVHSWLSSTNTIEAEDAAVLWKICTQNKQFWIELTICLMWLGLKSKQLLKLKCYQEIGTKKGKTFWS